jgi:small subunit ribosomal protein S6e
MKVTVANPEDGKTFQLELDDNKAKVLLGKKIKDTVNGEAIGIKGKFELVITGGSDKDGFPMRSDVHGTGRKRVLLTRGPGFHPKEEGERRRKTIRGNTIAKDIAQVNMKVVNKGPKEDLAKALGVAPKEKEPKGESKSEEKTETPKSEEKKEEGTAAPVEEVAEKKKEEAKEKSQPEEKVAAKQK